jgi:O-antigen/teichoic acid export membrane protein
VILARIFDPAQFGTYKQLFLVWSTIFYIAQVGMSQSLYYFLPRAPRQAGSYAANSVLFLGLAGLACFAAVSAAAPRIAQWLSNRELATYLPWIGLYLLFMMLSSALEIVMISRGRYGWASATYAASDLLRAAAFILPVLWFGQLQWLLAGAVLVAGVRTAATALSFWREFGASFRPDVGLLRGQFAYALPFGLAVLIETVQISLPQYAVSHLFDPATFAIFTVGCLQIPLVDFAASPTSDVMMVKMQESLTAGNLQEVIGIWHDTTCKLAMLFLPLAALMMVNAREIIVLLFTDRYAASAPIFLVWSSMILLTALQVDGVMRVFAQTRFLLALNLMRLAVLAGLLYWGLGHFHLIGAALACVVATATFKAAALFRMPKLLEVPASQLLPWERLGALVCAAVAGAAAAVAVKMLLQAPVIVTLAATSTVLVVTYAGVLWRLGLLESELCAG